MSDCHGAGESSVLPGAPGSSAPTSRKTANGDGPVTVALVGPPNSGKSTLFNRLTGLRQKVANFPGVTVEKHSGKVQVSGGREVLLLDLPGIYSLRPRSEDERVTHDVLTGEMADSPRPDAVLLVLDSTNLSRNLVLAVPVLSLKLPTLVVLNMADDLERRGGSLDMASLEHQLGQPAVLVSAARGEGIDKVQRFLEGIAVSGHRPVKPVPYQFPILQNTPQDLPLCRQWAQQVGKSSNYRAPEPSAATRRLDRLFLHPLWGPLIFLFVVIAVFQSIFTGAKPLMELVEDVITRSGAWLGSMMPDTLWKSLLIDGVWSGVGSVLVFLPQILLLFLFIGILEDSGYLARAAVIADRTMRRVGLQGKSFIPLLSAYACAVPAILATRAIENKRDRIATILIAPFMTCSARLPVYTLLIAAFIPDREIFGPLLTTRPVVMLGLYVLGFLAAFVTARLLKSSVLKSEGSDFILEMPPYRWPTLQSLGLRLYDRSKVFLRRAGTVILGVAVILWALASLPLENGRPPAIENSIIGRVGHAIEPTIAPLGFNWKIGVGLITSLAAREVIVGTLGTLYGIDANSQSVALQTALQRDLTFGGAVALMIFFAFAMQCMSTVAVVRRETGGWRWPAIQFVYMQTMAYAFAYLAKVLLSSY